MKVKRTDSQLNEFSRRELHPASHSQIEFDSVFKESVVAKTKEACTQLLQQIDEQSRELKRGLTMEGLKQYTQLVRSFMKEALSQTYKLDETTYWDGSGNRRSSILVKKIDQALEELVESVVKQEKPQLDLVARLDEIRGWLVDLYM